MQYNYVTVSLPSTEKDKILERVRPVLRLVHVIFTLCDPAVRLVNMCPGSPDNRH